MRPTQSVSMRRITLLVFAVMTLAAGRVAAQTTFAGPWQPRPTLGVALGVSGAITRNGEANSMVSGTLETPFADNGRIRIEGARNRRRPESDRSTRLNHLTGSATLLFRSARGWSLSSRTGLAERKRTARRHAPDGRLP